MIFAYRDSNKPFTILNSIKCIPKISIFPASIYLIRGDICSNYNLKFFFSVIKKYLKDRIIFCIFFINIRIYEYKFIYFGKVIDWNAHTIIHFENKCTFCEVLMYCAKVKYNFCQNILKSRFRNLKNMFQLFFFHFISRSGRASTWSFCDIYEKT